MFLPLSMPLCTHPHLAPVHPIQNRHLIFSSDIISHHTHFTGVPINLYDNVRILPLDAPSTVLVAKFLDWTDLFLLSSRWFDFFRRTSTHIEFPSSIWPSLANFSNSLSLLNRSRFFLSFLHWYLSPNTPYHVEVPQHTSSHLLDSQHSTHSLG